MNYLCSHPLLSVVLSMLYSKYIPLFNSFILPSHNHFLKNVHKVCNQNHQHHLQNLKRTRSSVVRLIIQSHQESNNEAVTKLLEYV